MPTPLNLMTGFLGVGKTTALLDLLRAKPGGRWGVIVNEYGEVGIDGALLGDAGDDSAAIREVAGGCVCCTSAVYFNFALAQMLAHDRPGRILVETTGVGHPSRLIDFLRGPAYAGRIELRATLCLVSPHDFFDPAMRSSPVFRDQVELADVLVLNKADLATAGQRDEFVRWGRDLFPPKLHVGVIDRGRLDPAWLDLDAVPTRVALFPETHADGHHHEPPPVPLPGCGRPYRRESVGLGHSACGWIFAPTDVFDEGRLLRLAAGHPEVSRLKGVFRVADDWIAVNRAGGDTAVTPTQYRRDSRLEAFADAVAGGWDAYERELLGCLAGGRDS